MDKYYFFLLNCLKIVEQFNINYMLVVLTYFMKERYSKYSLFAVLYIFLLKIVTNLILSIFKKRN